MLGSVFNQNYKNNTFYVFLDKDQQYNSIQYKMGLNICMSSTDSQFIFYGDKHHYPFSIYTQFKRVVKFAYIEIPDDANVFIYDGYIGFVSNKLVITEIIDFDQIPDDVWISISKGYNNIQHVLQNIRNQTVELCKLAIEQNIYALRSVKKELFTSEEYSEICLFAVKKNGKALRYIHENDVTKEICVQAVKQNEKAIKYVLEYSNAANYLEEPLIFLLDKIKNLENTVGDLENRVNELENMNYRIDELEKLTDKINELEELKDRIDNLENAHKNDNNESS